MERSTDVLALGDNDPHAQIYEANPLAITDNHYPAPLPAPPLESTVAKTREVSRSVICDFLTGIVKSRIFRAIVVTALAVGALFFLVATPAGWLIIAVTVGALVLALLAQMVKDKITIGGKWTQSLAFEFGAIKRLCKSNEKSYNAIKIADSPFSEQILLGGQANRLKKQGEHLQKQGVNFVLSVNEPWERTPHGLSCPYQESDWEDLGIAYKGIDAKDNKYMSFEQLDEAADIIDTQLRAGKKIYVHCKAGQGRSAMAIAAYLIKHCGMTAEQAKDCIFASRNSSTIKDKLKDKVEAGKPTVPGLISYAKKHGRNEPLSPPLVRPNSQLPPSDPNRDREPSVSRRNAPSQSRMGELVAAPPISNDDPNAL